MGCEQRSDELAGYRVYGGTLRARLERIADPAAVPVRRLSRPAGLGRAPEVRRRLPGELAAGEC